MKRSGYAEMREAVVAFLFARDGSVCYLCSEVLYKDDTIHVDHVEPVANGGEHRLGNFALTHARCNVVPKAGKAGLENRLKRVRWILYG